LKIILNLSPDNNNKQLDRCSRENIIPQTELLKSDFIFLPIIFF